MNQIELTGFDESNGGKPFGEYEDPYDIRKGRPGQSELGMLLFFPRLAIGFVGLKLERRNLKNPYDIDYHLLRLRDGQPIAYIDNEQRNDDYVFKYLDVPVNIPTRTFGSNIRQDDIRPASKKWGYYIRYPERSFHLTRDTTMTQAICCYAKDFVGLPRIEISTKMGPIEVVQVPRELTCFGKIYEHTIEEWLLNKLYQEGVLD